MKRQQITGKAGELDPPWRQGREAHVVGGLVWFDWFSSRIELETDDSHESQSDDVFTTSTSSIAISDTF